MLKNYMLIFCLLYCSSIYTQRGVQPIVDTDLRYNLITPQTGQTLVLNQPGNYKFSRGATSDLVSSGTILCITSDDITLDMQGFTLSQKDYLTSGKVVTAIHIADNVSNVLVKNGRVSKLRAHGIIIGSNCFNIALHNMTITKAVKTSILVGENTGSLFINNCLIANSTSLGETNTAIKMANNNNVTINNCSILKIAGDINNSSYGIFAKECSNCTLSNSIISGVVGKHALGIALNTCVDWNIVNNESNNNEALNGSSTGLYLVRGIANRINFFEASNNRGTDNGYGIQLKVNSDYNRLTRCITSNNYSSGTGCGYGILINKGDSNFVSRVNSFANTGGTDSMSEGIGIKIAESNGVLVEHSKFDDNNGNAGTGYGIFIEDSNQCIIEDNKLYYNHGDVASWGLIETGTASSYITKNVGFGNSSNFGVQQQTLNSIQNVLYDAPRSVQTSHRGNVNIIGA